MVIIGGALHYTSPFAALAQDLPFPLARHNMIPVLFMVPVVYAAFIFGPRAGFAVLAVVTLLMLPRALLMSPFPVDSALEVIAIALVSGLIILWFKGQQNEKERRREVLDRLEMARQELAFQVDIIQKNERRLATINNICRYVAQSLDLPNILHLIIEQIVAEMGVDAALIFLKDGSGRYLELVANRGVSEQFARSVARLKVGEGFNGRVAAAGEPLVVESASSDHRLTVPEVREEGIESQLIVPLRSRGATIGTLCVAVRGSRRFTTDEKELLSAIGSQVGVVIENAHLYREALRSEERYRDLFANATVAILVHDLDGFITAANNACTTLTGYPLAELLGKNVAEVFPAPSCAVLAKVQRDLLRRNEQVEPYDISLVRRDGVECILSMSTRLICDGGRPQGLQHIALDVTERRHMRDALNYYVRQILTAQEEERKRIARELHDETAQSMLLILQRLDGLTYKPGRNLSGSVEREIEELREITLQTLDNLRRLTRDLRPQILDDLGLVAAVEWLAEDVERQCGIKTLVDVVGRQRPLAPEAQLLLFRIVQEALSNVRRHSAASDARVTLEFGERVVKVEVRDNGKGFAPPASVRDLADGGRLGLVGMVERARLLGGRVTIESAIGQGTRVVVEVAA